MEVWRDIREFERLYQISNLGNVRRFYKNGKIISRVLTKNHGGYLQLNLSKFNKNKRWVVHRLVLQTFNPVEDSTLQVNHKNGIKTDNRLENLEWVTPSENVKHAFKIGIKNHHGEKHPGHKLTTNDVKEIKALLSQGYTAQEIVDFNVFPIKRRNISWIKTGKIWAWV